MDEERKMRYKFARLLASCPKDRLKLVLKFLEDSGITTDEFSEFIKEMESESKVETYKKKSGNDKRDLWVDSDDPITLLLREAYERSVSMTVVSSLSGVHRTTLYKYMRGMTRPGKRAGEAIKDAIEKIFADLDATKEE